jgi:quercetin dioxygenase-like cupin family protein
MALPHARSTEPIDVRPLGDALHGARTTALFKTDELEVIRLVLMAGKSLPPHKVPGEITIHCLEGKLEITCGNASHPLNAGELLYLLGSVEHGVLAHEDSSALVTIALRKS